MTIPNVLKPENIKRLMEIERKLYIMGMADRLTREEQDERLVLLKEMRRLWRRGE